MTSEDRDPHPINGTTDHGEGARSSTISLGPKGKRQLPIWQESLILLVIALGLAVLLKAFFIQAFYIPSESMQPGLQINDRILVQKVSYWAKGTPQRGDVVVFEDPDGWLDAMEAAGPTTGFASVLAKVGLYPTGGHLVKRVVGVGGDVITCCDKSGRLKVNGVAVDEKAYVAKDAQCAAPVSVQARKKCGPRALNVTVPEGYLFVMGDNREDSADSSRHLCELDATDCPPTRGFVPVDNVVGKVFALVWPISHLDLVSRADAFEDVPDPK
ncbi:signal peptidase I [Nocardioides sp.]|uniref:signal peptidase I n=1 Tax=Nocardioides sp. TaxID=35761 RepID=UPI002B5D1682|nr:signal peptidase I [Nocardioides sp.]HSX67541.1 signal peptidase I [Nocardioides sp.]